MTSEISTIEESIKIALDAADAATDITSEYNTIKKKHAKLGAEVKKVYMYTTIIFGSSIVAALASILFSSFIYFKSMSDLEVMITTNREALLIFAENVDDLKDTTTNLTQALAIQEEIKEQNNKIEAAFNSVEQKNKDMLSKISNLNSEAINTISGANGEVVSSLDQIILEYKTSQKTETKELFKNLVSENESLINSLRSPEEPDEDILKLIESHEELKRTISILQQRNQEIMAQIRDNDSMVKYP